MWRGDFQVIRTLDDPASLAQFTEIWHTRRLFEAGSTDLSEFTYKLDISSTHDSGRWLYRPDGLITTPSAKAGASVYIIPRADAFNALLGLEPDR